jgi:uncharacterized DUF497 family protein
MSDELRIDQIYWDDWNLEHIGKHQVTRDEVEEVVVNRPVVRETYKQRYQLLAPNLDGRMLSVIVGRLPGQHHVYYVFSARPASRAERLIYGQLKEGMQQDEIT